jgi:diacylglycerol kinase
VLICVVRLLLFLLSLQESLQSAINSVGVDVDSISRTTNVVTKTATDGATAAQPFISKALTFLTTTEPVSGKTTAEAAAAACGHG